LVIRCKHHLLNATERFEDSSHFGLCEVKREVLSVDVVVNFAEITLITRLIADNLDVVGFALCIKCVACGLRILEADEAVSTGLVVGAEGDFQRLDVSIALKVFFKLLRSHFFRNSAHKDVMIDNLLWVRSKQVVVEGKGT